MFICKYSTISFMGLYLMRDASDSVKWWYKGCLQESQLGIWWRCIQVISRLHQAGERRNSLELILQQNHGWTAGVLWAVGDGALIEVSQTLKYLAFKPKLHVCFVPFPVSGSLSSLSAAISELIFFPHHCISCIMLTQCCLLLQHFLSPCFWEYTNTDKH